MELISIIVPVYNVEEYLPKCLDSIINQTYKNLEIILVDDGSTDNSGKICDEYAFKDNRIKVIHKVNGGLSDARNAGLDICTGDYIGFVDSDDYIDKDMYALLYEFGFENNLDVAMCGAVDVIGDKLIFPKQFETIILDNKEKIIANLFVNKKGGAVIPIWNKLFRRKVIINERFDVGKSYEDVFLLLKWIGNTERFGRLPVCKYYYVRRRGSISHLKYYKDSILDEVYAYEQNLNIIKDAYMEVVSYGEYRCYWVYVAAIEKIYDCIDYLEHKDIVVNLRNKLRKNIVGILYNQHINCKEKIRFLLMAMSVRLYFVIKNLYKRVRSQKY